MVGELSANLPTPSRWGKGLGLPHPPRNLHPQQRILPPHSLIREAGHALQALAAPVSHGEAAMGAEVVISLDNADIAMGHGSH